jgi:aspartyl-tRNA(Asn)/glutamyl-tRNA(Gln) amidotransferase subunit A
MREAARYESCGATARPSSMSTCRTCLPYAIPGLLRHRAGRGSSNLSRFDGVRFGTAARTRRTCDDLYKRSRGEGFGAEVKRRILTGTYALSAGYYDAYYLQGAEGPPPDRRTTSRARSRRWTCSPGRPRPTVAFKLGEKKRRSAADVPGRHLHHRRQPGRPAGDVDSLRVLRRVCRWACNWSRRTGGGPAECAHGYQQVTDWHRMRRLLIAS